VLAERVDSSAREAERGRLAAEFSEKDAASRIHVPRTPLEGYEIVEVAIGPESPALGRRIGEVPWPPGSIVVAASEERELVTPRSDIELRAGEQVLLLVPIGESDTTRRSL
jgi:Trk K+ transport system NAD-binding subunit